MKKLVAIYILAVSDSFRLFSFSSKARLDPSELSLLY